MGERARYPIPNVHADSALGLGRFSINYYFFNRTADKNEQLIMLLTPESRLLEINFPGERTPSSFESLRTLIDYKNFTFPMIKEHLRASLMKFLPCGVP
ncbi:hypothetical protein L596_003837 [Steinernema carpocapsae]|uniref:Uncharacterized protein n=1 Tax=Steinernema carpocapsae TaxID=34508 RepID=A0A4U8UVF8_STECR|nr:hypothetical protein L596_003837 [Steinernema carpocapsae]